MTFAQGGSLYAYKPARDARDGWYEIDVPPAIVTAMAIGDQFGLMLDDEKGQTQTRHVIDSRESAYPPELIVEGTRSQAPAPGRLRLLKTDNTPAGAKAMAPAFTIPGTAAIESLNVAAAVNISLYEIHRAPGA